METKDHPPPGTRHAEDGVTQVRLASAGRLRSRCVFPVLISLSIAAHARQSQPYILYVGTYTAGESKGIYAYRYDAASGSVQALGLAAATESPSFLVADRAGRHLFVVNETSNYRGQSSGGVTAFTIDRKTGKLARVNQVASGGADPCYISLDKAGKYALVANYSGGSVAVFPILAGGRLGDASSVMPDTGPLGPNKLRQDKAHAHWIETSARNRFAYVADLGQDRILIYKFDAAEGRLSRGDSRAAARADEDFFSAELSPGTGPRHLAFSEDGNFMYVLGELDSTVTVFANDDQETYRAIQNISALPPGFSGHNTAAEIAIHPSGRFLYTSNRGHDSIAEFAVDRNTGMISPVGNVPTAGKTPRHFALDPSGTRLLVANQDSGNLVEFSIEPASGRLRDARKIANVPSPACLVFVLAE
jgi:6-phosphogluconolactonase